MTTTLAELLVAKTQEEIFQQLLAVYQAYGFPVQSWQPFGVERTRLQAFAAALLDVSSNYIPAFAAGGFTDYSTGDWLRLLAKQLYDVDYNPADFTVGDIDLTTSGGAGPYNVNEGELIAVFAASGNRYINTASGTIPQNGTLTMEFVSEFTGAKYNDPSNSGNLTLVTPLPGCALTNPAGDYSDVAHVGAGTGTLTLAGSPVSPHQVLIRIDSTGASGAAAWSYSLDGAPFVSEGAIANDADLGGTGIDVTLVDGGSGTSFVANDTYLFNTPGSWITTQGVDIEADANLVTRVKDRWSTLSPIPVTNLYDLLVRSTPTIGGQVTQVIALPDTVINSKINIVVAGPEGALSAEAIATIQEYINPRTPITVLALVQSPTVQNVTLGGIITASASQLLAAQGAIQTAMTNYIDSAGINGTIRISKIIELVMEVAGVTDISDVTINSAAANLYLGSTTTFVIASLQTLTFSYVTT